MIVSQRLANLANDGTAEMSALARLRQDLEAAEKSGGLEWPDQGMSQAREGVIAAVRAERSSRYNLGRTLVAYRARFKSEEGWMKAAEILAEAAGYSLRTLFRIIAMYEHAMKLPRVTLSALEKLDIDPAAGKNAHLIDDLLAVPQPDTPRQAAVVVSAVVEKRQATKKKNRTEARARRRQETTVKFAHRIVTMCLNRYGAMDTAERDDDIRVVIDHVVSTLRAKIPALREAVRRVA